MLGASEHSAFPLLFGLSLLPLGLAMIFRSFGSNERITYTLTGLLMLYIWEFDFSVGLIDKIFGETNGDIEMFFLSGVMVTIAATFVVVYNADIVLKPVTWLGRWLGALLPSIKMAVAYPLANRMRTGMTMAMFCLVVFALTVISSMNYNFNRLFISDRALGGWDVIVDENPTNPIGDLKAKLTETNPAAVAQIQSVGLSTIVGPRNGRVCQTGVEGQSCDPQTPDMSKAGFTNYQVRGEDDGFLTTAKVPLQTRAKGYETDDDVWRAVKQDDKFAVVDANALPGGGFGSAGFLHGVDDQANAMDPIPLVVVDQRTRKTTTVQVIGIIELGASGTYNGLHVRSSAIDNVFGKPDLRRYFVKTAPGTDNVAAGARHRSVSADDGRAGRLAAPQDRRAERDVPGLLLSDAGLHGPRAVRRRGGGGRDRVPYGGRAPAADRHAEGDRIHQEHDRPDVPDRVVVHRLHGCAQRRGVRADPGAAADHGGVPEPGRDYVRRAVAAGAADRGAGFRVRDADYADPIAAGGQHSDRRGAAVRVSLTHPSPAELARGAHSYQRYPQHGSALRRCPQNDVRAKLVV